MVTLIGMGAGLPGSLTAEGLAALQQADLIVGARRLLEHLPDGCTEHRKALYKPEEILTCLAEHPEGDAALLYSGDTGFYSGASGLLPMLRACGISCRVLPGISSVQLLAAAVGYAVSGVLLRGDAAHGCVRQEILPLTVQFGGRERRVRVLRDSGHTLTEPVSGKPVLILCRGEAALLLNDPLDGDATQQLTSLPPETACRCGLLPYRAVGTDHGLLLYFRPDCVQEADGSTCDCVCAVGPSQFENGQFDGLISV